MSKTIDKILGPYRGGKSCAIVEGRSLYDLELNKNGKIQPLIEILRTEAYEEENLVLVQYSQSTGLVCDTSILGKEVEKNVRSVISNLFNNHKSQSNVDNDNSEFINVLRGLLHLGQHKGQMELGDTDLHFLIVIEFPEHLLPNLNNGTHTREQIVAIELISRLSNSLGFRKSKNYTVLAESRSGLMESLIYRTIDTVNLKQPNIDEKKKIIRALENHYTNIQYEPKLSIDAIANLSNGTPNRSLESVFLSSDQTGKPITADDVFRRKQDDIISLSEGTLEAVGHARVANEKLAGKCISVPRKILQKNTRKFKNGDKNVLRNIMLAGSPSSGKTVLALKTAAEAGVPTFKLVNSKSQWVGESERKTKLMLSLLRNLGGIGLIDEIEHMLPLNRKQQTADSGVTQNIMGQLQSFLSDTSLAGQVSLIATTNRPNTISEAMRQRWIVVPVLMPLKEDYPAIILSIAKNIDPSFSIPVNNENLIKCAGKFHRAGASPREIRDALITSQSIVDGKFTIEHIKYGATDIIPTGSREASIFSDYVALSYCQNNSFLPWWDREKNKPDSNYPFPKYIQEILTEDHKVNQKKLSAKIVEMEPQINV